MCTCSLSVWWTDVTFTMMRMIVVCVEMYVYNSATPSVIIQGLRSYTFFRFAVCSHAGSLIGPFGDEIRCRTAQGREYNLVVFFSFSCVFLVYFLAHSVSK